MHSLFFIMKLKGNGGNKMKKKFIIFTLLFILVTVITVAIMNNKPETKINACILPTCDFV